MTIFTATIARGNTSARRRAGFGLFTLFGLARQRRDLSQLDDRLVGREI